MSDVQFEDHNDSTIIREIQNAQHRASLSAWMIQNGIVRTEKMAIVLQIIIATLIFSLSFYILLPKSPIIRTPPDTRTLAQLKHDVDFETLSPDVQEGILLNYERSRKIE